MTHACGHVGSAAMLPGAGAAEAHEPMRPVGPPSSLGGYPRCQLSARPSARAAAGISVAKVAKATCLCQHWCIETQVNCADAGGKRHAGVG